MKTLLYKQLRLVCQPMTLVFCLFGVMLLIPAYPYTVMWFYVMLGLFFSFLNGREQKDVYYSACCPSESGTPSRPTACSWGSSSCWRWSSPSPSPCCGRSWVSGTIPWASMPM